MVYVPTPEHGNERCNFTLKSVNYFWPLMKDVEKYMKKFKKKVDQVNYL